MERYEIPEDRRIAEWVDAVERGDEVVIVRDGKVVAEVNAPQRPRRRRPLFDPEKLAKVHALLGDAASGGEALIREMRDEERF